MMDGSAEGHLCRLKAAKPNLGYSVFHDRYVGLRNASVKVLTAGWSSPISLKCPLQRNCRVGPQWQHCVQGGKIKFKSGLLEETTNSHHFSTLFSSKNALSFSFSYVGYYESLHFQDVSLVQHLWNKRSFGIFHLLWMCLFLSLTLFGEQNFLFTSTEVPCPLWDLLPPRMRDVNLHHSPSWQTSHNTPRLTLHCSKISTLSLLTALKKSSNPWHIIIIRKHSSYRHQ